MASACAALLAARVRCFSSVAQKQLTYVPASEAVSLVRSSQSVFVHGAVMTPLTLVEALARRAGPELTSVEVYSIQTEGPFQLASKEAAGSFHCTSLFTGANMREPIASGRADYVPCFLSEIPTLFRRKVFPLDVAIIQVSPPDAHGFCSMGMSIDTTVAACEMAHTIIAEVNEHVPRTHGDGVIHCSRISAAVEAHRSLAINTRRTLTDVHRTIGRNVASLIEDRSTIQAGIGLVPDAVLRELTDRRGLGIHTELLSDGLMELVECGAVTNAHKGNFRGKSVTSFAAGSDRLVRFVDGNPSVVFLGADYTNDGFNIKQNPRTVAINSAVEIDLTGQVVADSIGTMVYSGVGGQIDFMRGSAMSEGGKPIIAFTSRTGHGQSRIVPFIREGAGVVTTRAHVHWVVTEHGIAELYGKNLRQRAAALRDVAHPDDREMLDRAIHARFVTASA
eukprot:CAMPEP_0206002046 /NCGR_PEP_ID=MMETSP1464-20131121/2506_1 /ASSEMBLY_ACC=CAM_ASM_001124 /TAXON_ID=119497 /ORGANISM="Exanthemachrysis gayraliae, Strain RCC1523" /LENGTH=449 /DNA_ID=CAMNT_0053375379 /DNA_START=44 /DNA_END=1393 /DNA_ORIENTATION=-